MIFRRKDRTKLRTLKAVTGILCVAALAPWAMNLNYGCIMILISPHSL